MSQSDLPLIALVRRTVLYVEDNQPNLQLVEQMLALLPDIAFLGASDAMSGIALARSHQPHVILMDISLPNISGIEALKILRGDPVTQDIPVLALSAHAMPSDIVNYLAQGFFSYITKPYKISEFMRVLDLALEFSEKSSGLASDKALGRINRLSASQTVQARVGSLTTDASAPQSSHCFERPSLQDRDTGGR